jgi:1D-myo-inositol 3-kinase
MPPAAPDLLIVGPVTWDRFGSERRPGGAVMFAARVATSMGVRAAILTAAGPDADRSALEGHEVRIVPATSTLTFEHRTTPEARELRLIEPTEARPRLTASDVPPEWLQVADVILAPLLPDDLDVTSFLGSAERPTLLAQGLQRRIAGDGLIEHLQSPADDLSQVITHECSVFLSDAEVTTWSGEALRQLVLSPGRVVVTRGRRGATVYRGGLRFEVPASPAEVVDTTGAGDVFATAFILAVSVLGLDDLEAARLASAYAAVSVEQVGPAPLPPLSEIKRRAGRAAGSIGA